MSYLVGPYAALSHGLDEAGKDTIYGALRESALVSGFEIPFRAPWTAEDVARAARRVGPDRDVVITTMPGLVARAWKDAQFGPASADSEGRNASVRFFKEAWRAAMLLGEVIGPDRVKGVTIASAPRAGAGISSASRFLGESLDAMLAWSWGATRVIVEHCDALTPRHPTAKGFLPLEDEVLAAVAANRSLPGSTGITINWGRSVIETRDPGQVPGQVRTAAESGALFCLMFSGSSDTETEYGAPWADSHLPPADDDVVTHGAGSLLTRAAMTRSISELALAEPAGGGPVSIGLKVSAPRWADAATRTAILLNSLSLLGEAEREAEREAEFPLMEAI